MTKSQLTPSKHAEDFFAIYRNYVISVEFKKVTGRIVSDWWVSRLEQKGHFSLVLHLELILNAQSERNALPEVEELIDSVVLKLARRTGVITNTASFITKLDKSRAFSLATTHLLAHRSYSNESNSSTSLVLKTSREYELAVQFGVSNPAALIASLDSTSVKAIQRRIYLARQQGALESFGQGRTSPSESG